MVKSGVPELTSTHLDALSLVLTDEALDHIFVALILLHVSEGSLAFVSQLSHEDLVIVRILDGRCLQSSFNDLLDSSLSLSRAELILDGRLELVSLLHFGTLLGFGHY